MHTVFTLRYAVRKPRSIRRIAIVAISSVAVAGAAAYGVHEIQTRVKTLNSDPTIGPVDWSAVFASPTLLRLTWQLAGDPRIVAPSWDRPADRLGETALFGARPEAVVLKVAHPLTYENGLLKLTLILSNVGPDPLVVPGTLSAGRIQRWTSRCGTGKRHALLWPGPCLARGVRVLAAGASLRIPISFQAPKTPCADSIGLITRPPGMYAIRFDAGDNHDPGSIYSRWSELPPEAIAVEYFSFRAALAENRPSSDG
jgi:hypothetical protein